MHADVVRIAGMPEDRRPAPGIQVVESLEMMGKAAIHEPIVPEVDVEARVNRGPEHEAIAVPIAKSAGMPADAAEYLARVGLRRAHHQRQLVLVNARAEESQIGIAEVPAKPIGMGEQAEVLRLEG